jgi:hypothetical protein
MLKARLSVILGLSILFSFLPSTAWSWETPNFSVVRFGASTNDVPNGITTDSAGNSYVVGYFAGSTDFNPSAASESATSLGLADAFISKYSPTGAFIWAKYFGGVQDDQIIAVATDSNDNLYVTGTFYQTVDFDYTSGVESITANGSGTDVFIAKISSNGDRVWTKTIGGTANDTAYAISTDSNGNVIIVGNYFSTMDFDPGAGTATLSSGGGYSDIFALKLNTNGEFIWVKTAPNSQSNDEARGVATFPNGDVVIVGGFGANTVAADFDPGPGTFTLSAGSVNHNIFIWKLNADGSFGWAKGIGNSATADRAYAVAVDSSSNVYTTGAFQSVAPFSSAGDTLTAQASYDAFLTKHDMSGNIIWVKQLAGSSAEYGRSIVLDSSSNLYVSGQFNGTIDLDPGATTSTFTSAGQYDAFVTKLSSIGNYLWGKSLGSTGNDVFVSSRVDRNQNILTTGYISAAFSITANSNTLSVAYDGAVDALYFCLDAEGNYSCNISSSSSNSASSDENTQRQKREEHERAVTKARVELVSTISTGQALTLDNLIAAELPRVSSKFLPLINTEISKELIGSSIDILTLTRIVKRYEVIERIEPQSNVYYSELLQSGIVETSSSFSTLIVLQLKKLPVESRDSLVEVRDAVASIERKFVERKLLLEKIIARINSRK